MKKKKYLFLFFIIGVFFLAAISVNAAESEEKHEVIRVGYPTQQGLTGKDEDGKYSGYTYEYLQTIAQYTGYEYEFVEVPGDLDTQLLTLMDMLKKGEIDVLGSMSYSEELAQDMDYVMNTYGDYERGLYVLNTNAKINSTNIYSMDNITVAIYGNSNSISTKKLEEYVKGIGKSVKEVFVGSVREQIEALEKGQADVLLGNSFNTPKEILRRVCSFDSQPMYFTVKKGDTKLLNKMNEAIAMINTTNPYYRTTLMQKYFYDMSQVALLTEEEKEYVKKMGTVEVLLLDGCAPIQYADAKGKPAGLAVNILEDIQKQTGLSFHITLAKNITEFKESLAEKEPDIILYNSSLLEGLSEAEKYRLSMPCLSLPLSLVTNKNVDIEQLEGEKAIDLFLLGDYETIEECLRAVNDGEAGYIYVNSYMAEYYKNNLNLNNIYIYQQNTQERSNFNFGIRKNLGVDMLSIFNKSVHNIPQEDFFQNYLYEIQEQEFTIQEFVRHNKSFLIVCSLLLAAVLFSAAFFWKYMIEKKNKEKILEQSRRDGLTDLYNGVAFRRMVSEELKIASEENKKVFMMIDIDRFKRVNDTFGHYYGDEILKGFANSAKQIFTEDVIGRVGGDEFVIFSDSKNTIEHIQEKCDQLKKKMRELPVAKGKTTITISVGGFIASGKIDYEQMFRKADEVMYQVKHTGRDGYEIKEEAL